MHVKHSILDRKFASLVLQQAHLRFPFTGKCISWSKLRTVFGDASLDLFSEGGLPRCIRSLTEQRVFATETM